MTSLAVGQLVGWMAVAAVDALMMAASGRRPLPAQAADRAAHYLYDAGLALTAGFASLAAVVGWQALSRRASLPTLSRARWLALALVAIGVGVLILPEDLSGLASRSRFVPEIAMIVAVAMSIPIVVAGAMSLRERNGARRATLAMVAAGLGVALLNHLVVARDYDGLHVFASWIAAIIVAYGVTDDESAKDVATTVRPSGPGRNARRAVFVAIAALAILTIAVIPPNGLRVDLLRVRGGSIAPWAARWRRAGVSNIRPVARAWFADREAMSAIASSTPSLLGKAPIVVFVTVDALRADVVEDPARAGQLPTFARLRAESVDFARARSVAPSTSASIASLFSGKYFSQLYWSPMTKGSPLICTHDDPSPRVPQLLDANGVQTVTFTGMPGLVNAVGFVRGFKEETFIPGHPFARADEILPKLLERLRRQGPEPLFLYVHFSDAHAPYDEGGTGGTDFERYVREVAIVDRGLARIVDTLSAVAPDRGALIVSADHGEAFGEHNTRYHGTTLYEELVRVPLFMRVPGATPRRVDAPVSLIDVGATILDLLQTPTPASFMGESLTPFLRGANPTLMRPLMLESSRGKVAMVFPDGMKTIEDQHTGARELYDVNADPRELVNLADQRPADAAQYAGLLSGFHAEHQLRRPGYTAPYVP